MDALLDWILSNLRRVPPRKSIPVLEKIRGMYGAYEERLKQLSMKRDQFRDEMDARATKLLEDQLFQTTRQFLPEAKKTAKRLNLLWKKSFLDQALETMKDNAELETIAESLRQSQEKLDSIMREAGYEIEKLDHNLILETKTGTAQINSEFYAAMRAMLNPWRLRLRLWRYEIDLWLRTILRGSVMFIGGMFIFLVAGQIHRSVSEEIPWYGALILVPLAVAIGEFLLHGQLERGIDAWARRDLCRLNTFSADTQAAMYKDDLHARLLDEVIPQVRALLKNS